MPSLSLQDADNDDSGAADDADDPRSATTATERYTRTLVGLTRHVWRPDCSFEDAIGAIARAAADALQIHRVSIWYYDRDAALLRCVQVHQVDLAPPEAGTAEVLTLRDDDYMATLRRVRAFDPTQVDGGSAGSHVALRDYLQRHRIRALLDAPASIEGSVQAVISHESVDVARQWTQEEVTFAASMGDYVGMAYEVARRRTAEGELQHLRLHDPATGLPNRDYLVARASQHLTLSRERTGALAVVHVHIDTFDPTGQVSASPSADQLMVQVANQLARLGSDSIEMARVGDAGFAFLVTRHDGKRQVIHLAEQCLAQVQQLKWDHPGATPVAAAGVVFADDHADVDALLLLRQAEEAAERARQGHRYRYEVFDASRHDTLLDTLALERALRDAFDAGDFALHYQPEYDAHTHRWVAAEALLRWHREGRVVAAGEFIEVAESSGLILPLGSWVLHRACFDAAQWPATPDGDHALVRVNVSTRQFDEGGVVEDVQAALAASGLSPRRLTLEITETTLMRDIDHARDVLQRLRALGIGVAIDDFGTGYASLTYLKQLPVDVLKIDRSFVESLPVAAVDRAIVAAVVGLAQSLDIDVIAEGVETHAQQQALQAMGVRRMQGWLYGRAVPQADIVALLGSACEWTAPVD